MRRISHPLTPLCLSHRQSPQIGIANSCASLLCLTCALRIHRNIVNATARGNVICDVAQRSMCSVDEYIGAVPRMSAEALDVVKCVCKIIPVMKIHNDNEITVRVYSFKFKHVTAKTSRG